MKKAIAIFLVLSMAFIMASCEGKEETPETTTPVEYVLPTETIDADITLPYMSSDSFEPYAAESNLNRDLLGLVYESLFTPADSGKGNSLLATSGKIEGTTVTVKIVSNAKFSDGTVLTASDVKASFEKARSNIFYKDALSNISSLEVLDNKTLKFNLYRQDDMALNVLDFPVYKTTDGKTLGTGKYFFDSLDEKVYLQVNTLHRDYAETWNKQIALHDMAGISGPIYPFKANEISAYKQDLSNGEYINLSSSTVSEKMNNLVYVGVNSKWAGSIASLSWVRKAINIGVSRSSVVATSFLGQGTAVVTPFRNEFYKLDKEKLYSASGDAEKAIAILEKNGYTLVNDEGKRNDGVNYLNIDILVCSENQYKVAVAKAVKKSLEDLGFKVTITKKKTSAEFLEALEKEEFCLYIGETQLTGNADLTEFFDKKGALHYGINPGFNAKYSAYRNGQISASEFIDAFNSHVPFIPLYYRKTVVSVNPSITGVSDGYNCYKNICQWNANNE